MAVVDESEGWLDGGQGWPLKSRSAVDFMGIGDEHSA